MTPSTNNAFFTSEFECKLDDKGRLALPAKLKMNLPSESTSTLMLRKGFEMSVIVYPMTEYMKIHEKFSNLDDFDPVQRKLKRMLFKSIAPVELDSLGRILVPKSMVLHAQLKKEVVLIGMGESIEIWDQQEFRKLEATDDEDYARLAKEHLREVDKPGTGQ